MRADTNYHFRSTHVEAHGLYTNRTPTSSYRGFGNPQMHFAQESLLDELAEKLAMDPTELRLKNFIRPGETSIHGFQISSCGLEACMEKAKELIGWEAKRRNPTPGKGIGVAALVHANSSRAGAPEFSGSSAMVRVDSVGRVTAYVGESEIGQGICTVVAQIVAEEFGVDPQEVYVVMGDTDLAPFSTGTNGSKLTTNIGNSVLFACRDAKEQILTVLRERLGMGPVAIEDGKVVGENGGEPLMTLPEAMEKVSYRLSGRPVIGFGSFEPHTVTGDRTGYGHLAPTYPFGVQMAEVTVAENGNFTIDRIVSVHDVGRVVNTQMALGQIYGGVMQAVGFTTLEDLAPNEHGVYAANTLLEYKAPTVWEMPEILGTFVETNDPFGPYGAKGIGEPPIIAVAPAVANAIYNACGVRFREIPITPVRIRQKKLEQQRVRAGEKKEDGL